MIEKRDPEEWNPERFEERCREPDGYEFIYYCRRPDTSSQAIDVLAAILHKTGRDGVFEETNWQAPRTIRLRVYARKPILVF